jgi:hypothetical protein
MPIDRDLTDYTIIELRPHTEKAAPNRAAFLIQQIQVFQLLIVGLDAFFGPKNQL